MRNSKKGKGPRVHTTHMLQSCLFCKISWWKGKALTGSDCFFWLFLFRMEEENIGEQGGPEGEEEIMRRYDRHIHAWAKSLIAEGDVVCFDSIIDLFRNEAQRLASLHPHAFCHSSTLPRNFATSFRNCLNRSSLF